MPESLLVACWSFTARDDLAWNAATIERGIAEAQAAGAKVMLTPECALVGYPSVARADLAGVDWDQVAETEAQLLRSAERAALLLVLGSAAPDGRGAVTNDAVAGGVATPIRYHKRCLTPTDRHHFVGGNRAATINAWGWRFGLGVCYDLRFDDPWRELAQAGSDALLVIAHMAGPDLDPGTKAEVIPAFCAVRAGAWATPMAFANTAAADRWLGSGIWDARGVRVAAATEVNDSGHLLLGTLAPRETFHPWYSGIRTMHLARK